MSFEIEARRLNTAITAKLELLRLACSAKIISFLSLGLKLDRWLLLYLVMLRLLELELFRTQNLLLDLLDKRKQVLLFVLLALCTWNGTFFDRDRSLGWQILQDYSAHDWCARHYRVIILSE